MKLDDFLRQFIEGYLFEDLKTMAAATPPGKVGHVGYPMLMSCAAGIEMLGILVDSRFSLKPVDNFVRYWERYLYLTPPRQDVGNVVYQLVRHGIAHNFAAKEPFEITKGEADHLVNDGSGTTLIDAEQLYKDLVESYEQRFAPVASGKRNSPTGETPVSMQNQLDALIIYNQKKMTTHAAPLQQLPRAAQAVIRTPSGPLGSVAQPAQAVNPSAQGVTGVVSTILSTSSLKP